MITPVKRQQVSFEHTESVRQSSIEEEEAKTERHLVVPEGEIDGDSDTVMDKFADYIGGDEATQIEMEK